MELETAVLYIKDKLDDIVYEQHTANLLTLAERVALYNGGIGMKPATNNQVNALLNEVIERMGK